MILRIRNFERFQGKAKRDFPWRKLYKAESGSFSCLPWDTRGLAALLLKHCDENGAIDCGDLPAEVVIGQLVRASAKSRRFLRDHIRRLVEDGYLTGATAEQIGRNPVGIRDKSGRNPVGIREESGRNPVGIRDKSGSQSESSDGNPSLLSVRGEENRGEENRIEERRGDTTAAPPRAAPTSDHHRFIAAFEALYRKRADTPPTWKPRQFAIVKALLTEHGYDESVTRAERMFATWRSGVPTLITLQSNWDSFADDKGPAKDVRVGHVRAEDVHGWTGGEVKL